MAGFLLFQALLEHLHELLEPASRGNRGFLLFGEGLLREFAQPVLGQIERFDHRFRGQVFQPRETGREGLIEPIKVALVLHHGQTGEIVKPVEIIGR